MEKAAAAFHTPIVASMSSRTSPWVWHQTRNRVCLGPPIRAPFERVRKCGKSTQDCGKRQSKRSVGVERDDGGGGGGEGGQKRRHCEDADGKIDEWVEGNVRRRVASYGSWSWKLTRVASSLRPTTPPSTPREPSGPVMAHVSETWANRLAPCFHPHSPICPMARVRGPATSVDNNLDAFFHPPSCIILHWLLLLGFSPELPRIVPRPGLVVSTISPQLLNAFRMKNLVIQ